MARTTEENIITFSTKEGEQNRELKKLFADISSIFVNISPHDVVNQIKDFLQRIGEECNIDRSIFMKYSYHHGKMQISHAWLSGGYDIDDNRVLECHYWMSKKLFRGEIVAIENVEDIPREANRDKELLKQIP